MNKIKVYILKCIQEHPDTGVQMSINDSVEYLMDRIYSEIPPERMASYGLESCVASWLQGMTLDVAYISSDVLELGVNWGVLSNEPTYDEEIQFLAVYYELMADNIIMLINDYQKQI